MSSCNNNTQKSIALIGDDLFVLILTFLGVHDLGIIQRVDKIVFSKMRIQRAVGHIMSQSVFLPVNATFKSFQAQALTIHTPASLFALEFLNFMVAVDLPAPKAGNKGYWVPRSWLTSARSFARSCDLPAIVVDEPNNRKQIVAPQPNKKNSKFTTISSPSKTINLITEQTANMTCEHGGLALESEVARTLVSPGAWKHLRRMFPALTEYQSFHVQECVLCVERAREQQRRQEQLDLDELSHRMARWHKPELDALLSRTTCIPSASSVQSWLAESGLTNANDRQLLPFRGMLLPGKYQVLSSRWLRNWRRYLRQTSQPSPGMLDCSDLLCHNHGLLVVPPHLTEFLLGMRTTLNSGLTASYKGTLVEILTVEEWDSLAEISPRGADFSVRLEVSQSGDVQWNVPQCHQCDPFNYTAPAIDSGGRSTHRAVRASQWMMT